MDNFYIKIGAPSFNWYKDTELLLIRFYGIENLEKAAKVMGEGIKQ